MLPTEDTVMSLDILCFFKNSMYPLVPRSSVQMNDLVKLTIFSPRFIDSLKKDRKRKLSKKWTYLLSYILLYVPIVKTMKMMTATPSRMARQLSSIDRRPYFRAPAMSPVWSTDLDWGEQIRKGIEQSMEIVYKAPNWAAVNEAWWRSGLAVETCFRIMNSNSNHH